VTISAEYGIELKGVSKKVGVEASTTFARSQSFQTSLTQSVENKINVDCLPGKEYIAIALYQFQTQTSESCLYAGTCSGKTRTAFFHCVTDPPPGYQGPKCLPKYCAQDDQNLCQKCDYSQNVKY
jgi:hypothetical protein